MRLILGKRKNIISITIPGVKEGDRSFHFDQVKTARNEGQTTEFEIVDEQNPQIIHRF